MITTELCAYTRAACDVARRCGVSRIELCSAPLEGGTTPSAALLRYARSLGGVRLSVMIRPRGGDFLYTDDEVELMAAEIRFARECGADGVVLGLLTADGEVDVERTTRLAREAGPLEVTFHRAFDMVRDPQRALDALIACGCLMQRDCQQDTCPAGIATQNCRLRRGFAGKPEHVERFMLFVAEQLRDRAAELARLAQEDV